MCGICGYTLSLGSDEDRRVIESMKEYLRHRGPDGEGSFFSAECVLGHRRLSIIDIESGRQPMANEDGSVQVVFNGEIYNYKALWKELEGVGHRFASDHSDTEVIVHGYEEWGTTLFERLNGIFAIALWDARKRTLVLARDHLGVKPLYYACHQSNVVFASEPKAILCHPAIKPAFNPAQVANYFFFRAPIGPDTLFKGIQKLAAGSFAVWHADEGVLRVTAYWRPHVSPERMHDECEAVNAVMAQIVHSVGAQLMSDVPLGIFLSGGVDSSLVAVAANAHEAKWDGFVVSTGGEDDETARSQEVADRLGVCNNVLAVGGDAFLENFERWAYYNDDPVADPSALALLLISKYARESGKKVMLAGEGGDELFGGYNSYRRFLFYDRIRKYPLLSHACATCLKISGRGNYREDDYMRLRKGAWMFPGTAHACGFATLSRVVHADLKPLEAIVSVCRHHGSDEGSALDRACIFDQRVRLANDLLPRTDRASMAVGLEARVPLLDHRLVTMANGIAPHAKIANGCLKSILKKALSAHLPRRMVYRRKIGFDMPLEQWLRRDLAGQINAYLRGRAIACLNYEALAKMATDFLDGANDVHAGFIWAYLLLEKWHEMWCGSRQPSPRGVMT
ncbi:MAG: asparagine synthase (glutamine-hydrolyzing) [bacterium]